MLLHAADTTRWKARSPQNRHQKRMTRLLQYSVKTPLPVKTLGGLSIIHIVAWNLKSWRHPPWMNGELRRAHAKTSHSLNVSQRIRDEFRQRIVLVVPGLWLQCSTLSKPKREELMRKDSPEPRNLYYCGPWILGGNQRQGIGTCVPQEQSTPVHALRPLRFGRGLIKVRVGWGQRDINIRSRKSRTTTSQFFSYRNPVPPTW